jgi:putative permease
MDVVRAWFQRYFSDPQVVILAVLLLVGFGVVIYLGDMLMPVLASLVIAYLLDGIAAGMQRHGVPRPVAVGMVYIGFLAFLLIVIFGLLPLLSRQVTQVFQLLPNIIAKGQELVMRLPELNPTVFTEEQVMDLMNGIRSELLGWGQEVLSLSVTSVINLITLAVYLVLMPMLVFFFLKDKERIHEWVRGYLPRDRGLATQVWNDVDRQLGNYVRGKFWEILIVWAVSYATFLAFDLQFALLLSALVGLSVIVPFVGATVVTIPVAVIAWFQWGPGPDFAYLLIAYTVIQALDGNLLVPLLFSEVVNLHPIAIIVAVLMFGGLWGFWGVFFAIPLATLVQAVLNAWPRIGDGIEED